MCVKPTLFPFVSLTKDKWLCVSLWLPRQGNPTRWYRTEAKSRPTRTWWWCVEQEEDDAFKGAASGNLVRVGGRCDLMRNGAKSFTFTATIGRRRWGRWATIRGRNWSCSQRRGIIFQLSTATADKQMAHQCWRAIDNNQQRLALRTATFWMLAVTNWLSKAGGDDEIEVVVVGQRGRRGWNGCRVRLWGGFVDDHGKLSIWCRFVEVSWCCQNDWCYFNKI